MRIMTFYKSFPYTRLHDQYFTNVTSLDFSPLELLFLPFTLSFYEKQNGGSERLSNLPRVTKLGGGRTDMNLGQRALNLNVLFASFPRCSSLGEQARKSARPASTLLSLYISIFPALKFSFSSYSSYLNNKV